MTAQAIRHNSFFLFHELIDFSVQLTIGCFLLLVLKFEQVHYGIGFSEIFLPAEYKSGLYERS